MMNIFKLEYDEYIQINMWWINSNLNMMNIFKFKYDEYI